MRLLVRPVLALKSRTHCSPLRLVELWKQRDLTCTRHSLYFFNFFLPLPHPGTLRTPLPDGLLPFAARRHRKCYSHMVHAPGSYNVVRFVAVSRYYASAPATDVQTCRHTETYRDTQRHTYIYTHIRYRIS